MLSLISGVASLVNGLPTNYTVDVVSDPEQSARLSILSSLVSAIEAVVAAGDTSAVRTAQLLATLLGLTSSINMQLVSDNAARAELLALMASIAPQVVATDDQTLVAQYVTTLRNIFSMTLVYIREIINPLTNRRLLSFNGHEQEAASSRSSRSLLAMEPSVGPVRDSVDGIYATLYLTLAEMSAFLLVSEGESHAFEQSGLSVVVTRSRLPLVPIAGTIVNVNTTLSATGNFPTMVLQAFTPTFASSTTLQLAYANEAPLWLVDVSVIGSYPNPYAAFDPVLSLDYFIAAAVSLGTRLVVRVTNRLMLHPSPPL